MKGKDVSTTKIEVQAGLSDIPMAQDPLLTALAGNVHAASDIPETAYSLIAEVLFYLEHVDESLASSE